MDQRINWSRVQLSNFAGDSCQTIYCTRTPHHLSNSLWAKTEAKQLGRHADTRFPQTRMGVEQVYDNFIGPANMARRSSTTINNEEGEE